MQNNSISQCVRLPAVTPAACNQVSLLVTLQSLLFALVNDWLEKLQRRVYVSKTKCSWMKMMLNSFSLNKQTKELFVCILLVFQTSMLLDWADCKTTVHSAFLSSSSSFTLLSNFVVSRCHWLITWLVMEKMSGNSNRLSGYHMLHCGHETTSTVLLVPVFSNPALKINEIHVTR